MESQSNGVMRNVIFHQCQGQTNNFTAKLLRGGQQLVAPVRVHPCTRYQWYKEEDVSRVCSNLIQSPGFSIVLSLPGNLVCCQEACYEEIILRRVEVRLHCVFTDTGSASFAGISPAYRDFSCILRSLSGWLRAADWGHERAPAAVRW